VTACPTASASARAVVQRASEVRMFEDCERCGQQLNIDCHSDCGSHNNNVVVIISCAVPLLPENEDKRHPVVNWSQPVVGHICLQLASS
jgi:hypothetical protein